MSPIDREVLVRRHTVRVTEIDPRSPLQVGNGEIGMSVDVTGLQTFPELYPVVDPAGGPAGTLLGTQSQWGWHSTPPPPGLDPDTALGAARRPYRTPRGDVPYVDAQPLAGSDDSALDDATLWLRANPHRLDLARMGLLVPDGGSYRAPSSADLGQTRQSLDLWSGTITSDVVLAGRRLQVTTACHPERDVLAVRVVGRGSPDGSVPDDGAVPDDDAVPDDGAVPDRGAVPDDGVGLAVRLTFPYGSQSWSNAADWLSPDAHTTEVHARPHGARVLRRFDGAGEATYRVDVSVGPGTHVEQTGAHEVTVTSDGPVLDLVVGLAPTTSDGTSDGSAVGTVVGTGDGTADGTATHGPTTVDDVLTATAAHWPAFWRSGAALDLSGSTDPRAHELERRAVLSQYLTAIQCAGSLPPQETGLVGNSWRGRFHLEMHWWHAAHFPLWGRPELLERSMGWYERILPAAQATARLQGYAGARWPKQVGPDGRESPSDIGPFLLWQQPHVIHLAELLRRAGDPADVVARLGGLVEETARFMADVAEPTPDGYALGPPLIPAQESYASMRDRVVNPPFELAYWSWALGVAQRWRVQGGGEPEPLWDAVGRGMVRPLVREGVLAAIGVEPFTIRTDHPSMVYGLGVVPATDLMDPAVVRATLASVLDDWDWPSTWGWDYPALAMTAARLGDPALAVDLLLRDETKNLHLPNGHNRQTDHLPVYLPGNGGLLAALALMAGGWDDDGGRSAPGFPDDGTWVVRHEGFVPAP
ncbi:hypothetical protein [Cellulomonas sp. ATA003]|uniref:hypothetical protein n=1 Tax=Cellulomonas sp. ATA003 TaxID=3073064 RepID=UPI00287302B7|nr:hypothetical protein [Cellulomonas sp. ATA003]WNB87153.1 hypothetical protein REH70_08560 [Cellulomonas sp. ATA003]